MPHINLHIHIGVVKTGSNYIQGFCQSNYQGLMNSGILYPRLDATKIGNRPELNHADIVHFSEDQLKAYVKELYNYSVKNNISDVILSWGEFTWETWGKMLAKVLPYKGFKVKVIVYVRRQDTWWEAAWKQWGIKTECANIYEYMNGSLSTANWYQKIKPWAATFGKENTTVRVYEKDKLQNNDVLDDFFHTTGIDFTTTLRDQIKSDYTANNRGFQPIILDLIARSKGLAEDVHDNSFFYFFDRNLSDSYKKQSFASYNLFTYEERVKLLKRYENDNQKLAKEYLGSNDPLFSLPVKNDTTSNDGTSANLENALPVILDVLMHIDKRQKQIEEDLKVLKMGYEAKPTSP